MNNDTFELKLISPLNVQPEMSVSIDNIPSWFTCEMVYEYVSTFNETAKLIMTKPSDVRISLNDKDAPNNDKHLKYIPTSGSGSVSFKFKDQFPKTTTLVPIYNAPESQTGMRIEVTNLIFPKINGTFDANSNVFIHMETNVPIMMGFDSIGTPVTVTNDQLIYLIKWKLKINNQEMPPDYNISCILDNRESTLDSAKLGKKIPLSDDTQVLVWAIGNGLIDNQAFVLPKVVLYEKEFNADTYTVIFGGGILNGIDHTIEIKDIPVWFAGIQLIYYIYNYNDIIKQAVDAIVKLPSLSKLTLRVEADTYTGYYGISSFNNDGDTSRTTILNGKSVDTIGGPRYGKVCSTVYERKLNYIRTFPQAKYNNFIVSFAVAEVTDWELYTNIIAKTNPNYGYIGKFLVPVIIDGVDRRLTTMEEYYMSLKWVNVSQLRYLINLMSKYYGINVSIDYYGSLFTLEGWDSIAVNNMPNMLYNNRILTNQYQPNMTLFNIMSNKGMIDVGNLSSLMSTYLSMMSECLFSFPLGIVENDFSSIVPDLTQLNPNLVGSNYKGRGPMPTVVLYKETLNNLPESSIPFSSLPMSSLPESSMPFSSTPPSDVPDTSTNFSKFIFLLVILWFVILMIFSAPQRPYRIGGGVASVNRRKFSV